MRAVVQRVSAARVTVEGATVGGIGPGYCVLVGAGPLDDEASARNLAGRIATLRLMADPEGKMNLDLAAVGGAVLVVSQFTLYADTSRGHRPSFIGAAAPEVAERLIDAFAGALRERGVHVETGRFGATMAVEISNDGPVTLVVSSGEPPWGADAG